MIKILSEDTIQKIAAGEVVEKPASIIKELVENSIDAKADNIVVQISNGGKAFIRVSDNGHGIESDQVELAFKRHATSKIKDFNDIYSIYSMGFRGEALASIVSAANVKIYTKTQGAKAGIHLEYDNNKIKEKKSYGMNKGTIIEVRDLFKYIPARLKFLSSDTVESNKITQLMYSFAIGNNDISFTYIKDDREIFNTNSKLDFKSNLETLFSKDYIDNSIEISSSNRLYKLYAIASNTTFYRGNRSMQFIYVNGRLIDSPEIVKSIEAVYQASIPSKRYPAFQLFIETSPENIDVNISPNKQKIKFNYFDDLLLLVKDSFGKAIEENKLAKRLTYEDSKNNIPEFYKKEDKLSDLIDKYKSLSSGYHSNGLKNRADLLDLSDINQQEASRNNKEDIVDFEISKDQDEYISLEDDTFDLDSYTKNFTDQKSQIFPQDTYLTDASDFEIVSILMNRYLLLSNNRHELELVDLKRAEQRLIFDKLSENLGDGIKLKNDLISPYIFTLSKKDMEKYQQNLDIFEIFGFEIDMLGDNDLAIRSTPYIGELPADQSLFLEILDSLNKNLDKDLLINNIKNTVAANISSKNKIYNTFMAKNIYNNLNKSKDKYKSPFGKNIIIRIYKSEIERLFE